MKDHLEVKFGIHGRDLVNMPMERLFSIIACETQVYSQSAFYKELKEAMSHVVMIDFATVNPVTHEAFYFH
jgi:hypothetical protein